MRNHDIQLNQDQMDALIIQKYGPGWENRIRDELELFFDGDGQRNH